MDTHYIPRRRFLVLTAGGISALAIGAACGDDKEPARIAIPNASATTPPPIGTPNPPAGAASATTTVAQKGTVLVGENTVRGESHVRAKLAEPRP